MDRKLDAGALLVAGAALLLVISLFLDWFGLATAWQAFEVLDLVLVGAAVAAVAAAFGKLDQRVLTGAALVVLVVVVTQLVSPPPAGQGEDREIGAWLALVSALGLLGGAALVSAQIAVTVDVRARERRQRVAAVDKRGGGAPAEAPVKAPLFDAGEARPDAADAPTDRFAPSGSERVARPADPDATQAFAVGPDDDER